MNNTAINSDNPTVEIFNTLPIHVQEQILANAEFVAMNNDIVILSSSSTHVQVENETTGQLVNISHDNFFEYLILVDKVSSTEEYDFLMTKVLEDSELDNYACLLWAIHLETGKYNHIHQDIPHQDTPVVFYAEETSSILAENY